MKLMNYTELLQDVLRWLLEKVTGMWSANKPPAPCSAQQLLRGSVGPEQSLGEPLRATTL